MDGRLRHRQRGTRDRLRLIRRPRFRLLLSGRTPRGVWWRVCNTLSMGGNPGRRRPRRLRSFLPRGPRGAILRQGTPVHLVFATDVNSKTADVGEQIQLTLAEDIKAADMVLVPKGQLAVATVTQVDKTGAGGAGQYRIPSGLNGCERQLGEIVGFGNAGRATETTERGFVGSLRRPIHPVQAWQRRGDQARHTGNGIRRCRYFALDRGLGKLSHQLNDLSPRKIHLPAGFP